MALYKMPSSAVDVLSSICKATLMSFVLATIVGVSNFVDPSSV